MLSEKQDEKKLARKSLEVVMTRNEFSPIQLNLLWQSITLLPDMEEKEVDVNKLYPVEFQRSEIPQVGSTDTLIQELERLQDMKIKNMLSDAEWSSVVPFPKMGLYSKGEGTIKLWLLGDYVKLLVRKKKGFAPGHVLEYFKLQGAHPKNLFDVFGAYKNRDNNRWEVDVQILKEQLGIPEKYKNRNQEFFDRIIKPAIKQINEKTSITVKGKYTRSNRRRKGFYTFDVYRDKQEAPEIKKALPKKKKQQKVLPEDFILSTVDEGFLSSMYPNAEFSPEAFKGYESARVSGELKKWRKSHTRIKNFLPVNTSAGVRWYVISYTDKEYQEIKES